MNRKGHLNVRQVVNFVARTAALILFFPMVNAVAQSTAPQLPDKPKLDFAYYLQKLGEPSMWKSCEAEVLIYRFLEISPKRGVRTVRIERANDNLKAIASVYEPPTGPESHEVEILQDDWEKLIHLVDTVDFWRIDSEWEIWRPDGTEIFVEGCLRGKYHAIKREPGDVEIVELTKFFSKFLYP